MKGSAPWPSAAPYHEAASERARTLSAAYAAADATDVTPDDAGIVSGPLLAPLT
jgi:hypothetical protein